MRRYIIFIIIFFAVAVGVEMLAQNAMNQVDKHSNKASNNKETTVVPSAWTITQPLGQRIESTIDTLQDNFCQNFIPSNQSIAYATTGNYGAPGMTQIFFDRKPGNEFFFEDVIETWIGKLSNQKYYNTGVPMTLLSYTTGGSKYNNQDRLNGVFSGNINKQAQVGALLDYIYSKGNYDYQATKNFMWGINGSYIGDRYEMHAFYNNYNMLNKENGGITDDRYITNPAQVQGGETKVDAKTIPTNLTNAHSRLVGHNFYMNHRYKVGYYRTWKDSINDTIEHREYIPVTSFIWTMDYKTNFHRFLNENATEDKSFFKDCYLSLNGTDERTEYSRFTNTLGISLLEGFNKYAKFGLAAYATYEIRKYKQVADSMLYDKNRDVNLSPAPDFSIPSKTTENVAWIGGQLTKQRGSILTYSADARFGVLGGVAGDINISGDITTRIPLFGDSVKVTGYGYFRNEEAPYLLQNFVSNHFIWKNDFNKVRRVRIGGRLVIPHTHTHINIGVENLTDYVYFDNSALPSQYGDNIQIISADLQQNLAFKALHWDNKLSYQTSTEESVISLPKFAVYSNLYLKFKVAGVMNVQLGVDGNYYTNYYAPGYNPATMVFHTQNEIKCGNFLWMNAYANVKLKKTRFFVLFSHVNQGLFGGNNYFSMPHYPLNGRKFQFGISVDFAN